MKDDKVRLSIDLEKLDHKLLKLECSRRGLIPKLKIQELILEWLEDIQDVKNKNELQNIVDKDRWSNFEEIRRRMNWDAL